MLFALLMNVAMIVLIVLTLMAVVEAVAGVVVQANPLSNKDNLKARRIYTQTRVLARSTHLVLAVLGLAFILLVLPGAKQIGASLLASAGVAGLITYLAQHQPQTFVRWRTEEESTIKTATSQPLP